MTNVRAPSWVARALFATWVYVPLIKSVAYVEPPGELFIRWLWDK